MPTTGAPERCHRCLQPAPYNTRRCPQCGAPQNVVNSRRLTIYAAVAGILAILAVVGFSLYLKPAVVDIGNLTEEERQRQAPPPKAPKKPPLN